MGVGRAPRCRSAGDGWSPPLVDVDGIYRLWIRLDTSVTVDHWERDLATGRPRRYGHVPDVLVTVERPGNVFEASTDAQGRYELTLPPGKYDVIALPPAGFSTRNLRKRATIIQVDGGEAHEGLLLTVPSARRSYRLTGAVLFEDGRSASGAFVSLKDGTATWRQVAVGIKAEPDGTFSFLVHEGLSYVAQASYWDERQRIQQSGSVGPFVVTGDTGPLRVVISSRR